MMLPSKIPLQFSLHTVASSLRNAPSRGRGCARLSPGFNRVEGRANLGDKIGLAGETVGESGPPAGLRFNQFESF
jgi:hypothetical protein